MDTTKVTFSTVYNDFKEALSGIGDSLKVGAEHVYEVLVKQQLIQSVTYLLIDIFLLVVSILSVLLFRKLYKDNNEGNGSWESSTFFSCVAATVACIIFIGHAMTTLPYIVTGFANPEYGAMQDIYKFVK